MRDAADCQWLIRKGGYFYRPNRSGYTTKKSEAGRYTEEEAKAEARVEPWRMEAVHQDSIHDDAAPALIRDHAHHLAIDAAARMRENIATWLRQNGGDDFADSVEMLPAPRPDTHAAYRAILNYCPEATDA